MVMKDRWAMSAGLRRASALAAIVAMAVGGAKVVDDHTLPGSGFSAVATVAADPTGPTGGGMGPGGMNGSQFQPPQMPSSMPDYQGGNNQPPLDQNNGISIYNSGSPQAPQQVPGQQAGQQPQQAQQPAHGTQIPDYQTATPYTQGPGKPNPDYQAPQQNSPQQPQQGQQPQQPNQQQPQNKQDDTTQQLDQQQQQRQQQCQSAAEYYGIAQQMLSFMASAAGGAGSLFQQPSRKLGPGDECNCAPEQAGPQDSEPSQEQQQTPRSDQNIKCDQPKQTAVGDDLDSTIPNRPDINLGGDGKTAKPLLNGKPNPLNAKAPPPTNPKAPDGARPIPTGTAAGPAGKDYAFYSMPQYYLADGVTRNPNFVTPNSAIVDLAHPDKIIGTSPLAQTSGAYDPVSKTMLLAGNTSATPEDPVRALYQSDPIKATDGPYDWIKTVHFVGNILPGDRESQLIALGSEGKNGFLFVGSSGTGPIEAVIASTPQELTQKLQGQVLVPRDVSNINGIDGPYGPTVASQAINPAGTGNIGLKISQFWDPAFKAAHPDVKELPYDPRIYSTSCTVQ